MAVLRLAASEGATVERGEESDAEILSNALTAVRKAAACKSLSNVAAMALDAAANLLSRHVPGERGRD